MSNASFILQHSELYVSAHALDGTCVYVRAKNGIEVMNSTPYADTLIMVAQQQAAEYFGVQVGTTLFYESAPKNVDKSTLFLLAFGHAVLTVMHEVSKKSVYDADRIPAEQ